MATKYNPVGHFSATSSRAIYKVALMRAMADEQRDRDNLLAKKVSRSAPKRSRRQLGDKE